MALEKPYKKSNLTNLKVQKLNNYITGLDRDVKNVTEYLNTFPPVYKQSTQPTLATGSMAFWKDTDDSKYYFILDIDGVPKKVELT